MISNKTEMWILRGLNCSPAFEEGEKHEEESGYDMFLLFCAKQKAAVFSGIIGLPDQYWRCLETVMEFVVNGSGDICSLSPALTAFMLIRLK